MIVSHKYKYVFIELPLTGSTAISAELRKHYDGVWTLFKHATYHDFLRIATPAEKNYFVFSCIRNPLDQAVSYYFKYKTNPNNLFTDPKRLQRKMGLYQEIVKFMDEKKFRFVQKEDTDFTDFFLKFYKVPYSNWSIMAHRKFDFVIRFENLQEDFSELLRRLKIEQKRALPLKNKTPEKQKTPVSYYTPETYKRARNVFGPFMKEWGYRLPAEWGCEQEIPRWIQLEYYLLNILRSFSWRYLRRRI